MTKQEVMERVEAALAGISLREDKEYIDWCNRNHTSAPLKAYTGEYNKDFSVRVWEDHITLFTASGTYRYEIKG